MEMISTDVLVIGNGAAGMRAALAASEAGTEVILIGKAKIGEAGSTFSRISRGWGIQALVGEERTEKNLEVFYEDILRVGLGECQPELVRVLVEESGPRFEDLLSFGIHFRKDSNGKHLRAKGCFSDHHRAFLTQDMKNVKSSFLSILQHSGVRIVEAQAVQLIVRDGCCWGGWFFTSNDEMLGITAKATILACGGGVGIFSDNLVGRGDIGEGYALAYGAGARLENLEFIQFMLGLKHGTHRLFLPLGELSKPRMLMDHAGKDLLYDSSPHRQDMAVAVAQRLNHMPFSCRDSSHYVDLAIAKARNEGQTILWNGVLLENSLEPCEVIHFAHAFNGGIQIDANGRSSVPGLFAAGEVAAGPHGADRIGGCMMTATQVFGYRAGRAAAMCAREITPLDPREVAMPEAIAWAVQMFSGKQFKPPFDLELEVQRAMTAYATIPRSEEGLRRCLEVLSDCQSELEEKRRTGKLSPRLYFITANMILTGKLVADSALHRTLSLGSHYRQDFPPRPSPS